MTETEKTEVLMEVIRSSEQLAPFVFTCLDQDECPEMFRAAAERFLISLERLHDTVEYGIV